MPVHMGVMCEKCRTVHFISPSSDIQLSRSGEGVYLVKCTPPCSEAKDFRKDSMRPYRVSDEVFRRGYGKADECELVTEAKPLTAKTQGR